MKCINRMNDHRERKTVTGLYRTLAGVRANHTLRLYDDSSAAPSRNRSVRPHERKDPAHAELQSHVELKANSVPRTQAIDGEFEAALITTYLSRMGDGYAETWDL